MANLKTQFMGMELKNPVLAAAGPWTGSAEGLQAAIDAGAGAVLTETISQEVYPRFPPAFSTTGARYTVPRCTAALRWSSGKASLNSSARGTAG